MPAVLEKARQDRADGHLWKARQRLESFISSSGYDRWVLELLGEVCHEMGDYPAAGRYWFFVELKNPQQHESVTLFLALASKHPSTIGQRWPAKLREVRPERLPVDARARHQKIAEFLPKPRVKPIPTNKAYTSRDLLFASGCILVALFVLFCFSVGFAQVIGLK